MVMVMMPPTAEPSGKSSLCKCPSSTCRRPHGPQRSLMYSVCAADSPGNPSGPGSSRTAWTITRQVHALTLCGIDGYPFDAALSKQARCPQYIPVSVSNIPVQWRHRTVPGLHKISARDAKILRPDSGRCHDRRRKSLPRTRSNPALTQPTLLC